jgi:predicted RNA binding protein YcfA (HicA-like mRNA interferase family)
MKYSELEKKLKKEGCSFFANGGNHPLWISNKTGETFPMSYHRSEEVKKGTLKEISKLSGVKL